MNKVVFLFILLASLAACGPSRMECFGDASVRCRSAAVDRALANFDRKIADGVKSEKQAIISSLGAAKYDRLIELLDEYRDAVEDTRPNWLFRVFASDMQVEAQTPLFKQSRELNQLLAEMKSSPKAARATSGEKCLEARMIDYRKSAGQDAWIKFDQIQEWRAECGLPTEE